MASPKPNVIAAHIPTKPLIDEFIARMRQEAEFCESCGSDQAARELRSMISAVEKHFTISTPHTQTSITPDDISNAIKQLRRSERGDTALRHFRTGLQRHEMTGLDTENWRAYAVLANACRIYGAGNILGVLETLK